MKIYLSPTTAGRYGGALKGNLRYLDKLIQLELDNSAFNSSFDELWLTLSYPPMYSILGLEKLVKDFKNHYDNLPYSRLSRRYKKIDITLKAPEFSEHFDKEDQSNYHGTFEIEEQYKNISEVELGKILVDKYLEAIAIINVKLEKDDIFNFDVFKKVLISIKNKIDVNFLESINQTLKEKELDDTIRRALEIREKRNKQEKPKDKLIRDLRVFCNGLPLKALYPYDYQYTEIF